MKRFIPGTGSASLPTPKHRICWVAAAMVATLAAISAPMMNASAASSKSGGGGHGATGSVSTSLSLISETSWNNPNSPAWCLNEDDNDYRTFSGSLAGSYATNYRLCNASVDYYNGMWWDAGGIGLQSDVYVIGQLSDLTITAPDGTAHHAVLMGQTSSRGVTVSHYAACYVPSYSLLNDIAGTSLIGGTWQFTLSGQLSSANWTTRALMTDATYQLANCPSSEQNLVSS